VNLYVCAAVDVWMCGPHGSAVAGIRGRALHPKDRLVKCILKVSSWREKRAPLSADNISASHTFLFNLVIENKRVSHGVRKCGSAFMEFPEFLRSESQAKAKPSTSKYKYSDGKQTAQNQFW
jgi:hypothetical protein